MTTFNLVWVDSDTHRHDDEVAGEREDGDALGDEAEVAGVGCGRQECELEAPKRMLLLVGHKLE